MTVEDGKTVAKPEPDPEKNGYDFGGWYSGEAEYDFTAAVKSDLTLTAKWTAHKYTITYVLNGGTDVDNPATYTIETDDITLKDPTAPADKPNFGGWFKEAEFKTQVTKIAKGSTGDLTLYAYFSENAIVKHSVKVMCGDTEAYSGEVLDRAALSEDDVRKAAKAKIPEGCELEGFYSDAAFTTKFDFSKAITADTVIYAKITEKTFTVSFEGLEAKQTVGYGKTATEPADKPTKDGFTFGGWDFDFSTAIKADTAVKAKWVEEAVAQTWTPFGTVELAENKFDGGANYQAINSVLPGNYQAKQNDVIRLVLKGTSNKDISNLKAVLIDNGKKKDSEKEYNWTVLSEYVVIAESIKANEEFEYSVKIPVKADSSAAGSDYCKISLMCDYADESDSRILTFAMPDTLSLDVTSLTNGYSTSVTVNDDGSVSFSAETGKAYGQAVISLGGKQDLTSYTKLVIEYSQTDKIKVALGTTGDAWGAATDGWYPEGATEKTVKEIDISSESARNAVYSVCFGQAGSDTCSATIYSVKLVK